MTLTDKEYEHISELFIEKADLADFANYGCKATNEIGSDYLVITITEPETVKSSHILYIVIGVFAIVIILLLLTLCIVLSKRRNRSNMELIKAANDQTKRREKMKDEANNYEESFDDAEGKLSGLEPDLILPFKRGNQLRRNILSEEEEEEPNDIPKFMLTPLEDESQSYYNSHKPFMIQRFEKQPLSSNPSFSSIEYSCSPASNSFDSGNSGMESQSNSLSKQERPFPTKNVHVTGRNKFPKPANKKYALEDDPDDQYVTLLPSAHVC